MCTAILLLIISIMLNNQEMRVGRVEPQAIKQCCPSSYSDMLLKPSTIKQAMQMQGAFDILILVNFTKRRKNDSVLVIKSARDLPTDIICFTPITNTDIVEHSAIRLTCFAKYGSHTTKVTALLKDFPSRMVY